MAFKHKESKGDWFRSGLEIVAMPSQVKVAKVSGADYDEAKANAKLIANAPKLLQIAEMFYDHLGSGNNSIARQVTKDVLKDIGVID